MNKKQENYIVFRETGMIIGSIHYLPYATILRFWYEYYSPIEAYINLVFFDGK